MKENKKIFLGRIDSVDNNMSIEKIIQAQNTRQFLIGNAVSWNLTLNSMEVNLGNGIIGYIPGEEVSIYPVFFSNGFLTPSIREIIGKNIVVSVLGVVPDGEKFRIILSRKKPMLTAFNTISETIGNYIECCITSIASHGLYVDVGNGISGLIHYTNLCITRLSNFADIGIKVEDKIRAKIISVDDKFHVRLNYKDQFENLSSTLEPDDLVQVTITQPINSYGYFAYLNPNTSAVIDVPNFIHCSYGDKMLARVKGTRKNHPDQLKLQFVSFID